MDNGKNSVGKHWATVKQKNVLIDNCICDLCKEYQERYDLIQVKPRWLTISPPENTLDPDDLVMDWNEVFFKMRYFARNMLGIVEVKNCRIHFHIVYECKDSIREYHDITRIKKNSIASVYNGYPEQGLHYLFKDIDDIRGLLTVSPIITTIDVEKKHTKYQKRLKDKKLFKSVFECQIGDPTPDI